MDTNGHKIISNHRLHRLHRFSSIASPQAPIIARRIDWRIMKSNRKGIPTAACGSAVVMRCAAAKDVVRKLEIHGKIFAKKQEFEQK